MSPPTAAPATSSSSFPRVSGDEPSSAVICPLLIAFSPRERG